jgi:hypothetical protein
MNFALALTPSALAISNWKMNWINYFDATYGIKDAITTWRNNWFDAPLSDFLMLESPIHDRLRGVVRGNSAATPSSRPPQHLIHYWDYSDEEVDDEEIYDPEADGWIENWEHDVWSPPPQNSDEESWYLQGIKAKLELSGKFHPDFIANMDTTSLQAFDASVHYGISNWQDDEWRDVFSTAGWNVDWNADEILFIEWSWDIRLFPNLDNNDELIRVNGHNNNYPALDEDEIPRLTSGCSAPAA